MVELFAGDAVVVADSDWCEVFDFGGDVLDGCLRSISGDLVDECAFDVELWCSDCRDADDVDHG